MRPNRQNNLYSNKSLYFFLKPFIDRILALLLFILFIPVMIAISIIIFISDPKGPIIFSQTRIGKNGRKFTFYKFRTMWQDAKKRYPHLYRYTYSKDEIKTLRFKIKNDPRLTTYGKYLRKTSLDELPNLINVMLGHMSLVGPRPEIPEMLPYYSKQQKIKFTVQPGVTGYAQIKGRGLLTFQETIIYDLQYINHQGFITDFKIFFQTIYVILKGFGAF